MRYTLVLLTLIACTAPAFAQRANWKDCSSSDPQRMITGCSAIIARGAASDVNLISDAYENRARAYHFTADYERAIGDYTRVIELDPKNADAFLGRGSAYGAKKDYDGAIPDFTRVIELEPKSDFAFVSRGYAYSMKQNYDFALADLRRAIELNPEFVLTIVYRGNVYPA